MENRNHENLGELLRKFFDAEQAEGGIGRQEPGRAFPENTTIRYSLRVSWRKHLSQSEFLVPTLCVAARCFDAPRR